MLLGPDAEQYRGWELPEELLTGTAPRHLPPEGMRFSREEGGLVPKGYQRPAQDIWDEIVTGKR
jgi:hypothetical protein